MSEHTKGIVTITYEVAVGDTTTRRILQLRNFVGEDGKSGGIATLTVSRPASTTIVTTDVGAKGDEVFAEMAKVAETCQKALEYGRAVALNAYLTAPGAVDLTTFGDHNESDMIAQSMTHVLNSKQVPN